MTTKIEHLINSLDDNNIQCKKCKRWSKEKDCNFIKISSYNNEHYCQKCWENLIYKKGSIRWKILK